MPVESMGVGGVWMLVLQFVECIREVRGGVIDTLPYIVKPHQLELM